MSPLRPNDAVPSAAAAASAGRAAWPPAWLWCTLAALALLRWTLGEVSGASLHVDEAQYWDWSRHLQWGYYSKPPLIAALIAASTALFGDGEGGVRALTGVCWVATGAVLWSLARSMAEAAGRCDATAVAGWSAGWFLTGPLAALLGLVATTDAALMLMWALVLHGLWSAVVQARPWGWLWVALALGLGLLDKYTMAAVLPGALWWCWRHGGWPAAARMVVASAVALLIFAPNLWWNAQAGWPTWRHTAEITVQSAPVGAQQLQGLLLFVAAQCLLAGPVLLLAGPLAAWRRRNAAPSGGPSASGMAAAVMPVLPQSMRDLLLAAALPLVAAALLQAWRGHAEVNWAAPAHLSLVLAAGWWSARWWPRRGQAVALLGGQLLLVTLLSIGASAVLHHNPDARVVPGLDPWMRMRPWGPALAQLAPHLPPAPPGQRVLVLGSTRTVLAHAGYHWRQLAIERAALAGSGLPSNHYEQTCPWRPGMARGPATVLLTEEPLSAAQSDALGGARLLSSAPLSRRSPSASRLYLWQLTGPPAAAVVGLELRVCR